MKTRRQSLLLACLTGLLTLCTSLGSPGDNDAFSQALALPPTAGEVHHSNFLAQTEPGEPPLPGAPAGRTLWYRWTAPANGLLQISIPSQDQPVLLAVAEDKPLGDVRWLSANAYRYGYTDSAFVWRSRESLSVPVRSGTAYLLAADTQLELDISTIWLIDLAPPPRPDGGSVHFAFAFSPAPPNDEFLDAFPLTGMSNLVTTSNFAATLQPNEPTSGAQLGGVSVWYTWTAPISGRVTVGASPPTGLPEPSATVTAPALSNESIFYRGGGIDWVPGGGLNGTWLSYTMQTGNDSLKPFPQDLDPLPIYPPIFAVYSGDSLASLTLLARGTSITFQALSGANYRIAVEAAYHASSPISFYLVQTPPPSNDSFANAIPIQDASAASLFGHLVSASREPGEPDLGPAYAGGSAWFRWMAPSHGTVTLSGIPSRVAVYTGNSLSTLTLIAKSTTGSISFLAQEGEDYSIALISEPASAGPYTISASAPKYRLYLTTTSALLRDNYFPRFYGLRGKTAILSAKTETGWRCVEIQPIQNRAVVFLNSPGNAFEQKLKVTTIDQDIPAPHIQLAISDGLLRPTLIGLPGQNCELAFSPDLLSWTVFRRLTLSSRSMPIHRPPSTPGQTFYRATQYFPFSQLP